MTAAVCALALCLLCLWGSLLSLHTAVQRTAVQARCAQGHAEARLERLLGDTD